MTNIEKASREKIKESIVHPMTKANMAMNLAIAEYCEGNNQRAVILTEYAIELLREAVVAAGPLRNATQNGELGAPITGKK